MSLIRKCERCGLHFKVQDSDQVLCDDCLHQIWMEEAEAEEEARLEQQKINKDIEYIERTERKEG